MTVVNPGRPDAREVPVLTTEPLTLAAGDTFCHRLAGGGGYGEAMERDPAEVAADVVLGKVTVAHARSAYGVAVRELGVGRVEIDRAETARLRAPPP
jgi:N-methylhydantoinase B